MEQRGRRNLKIGTLEHWNINCIDTVSATLSDTSDINCINGLGENLKKWPPPAGYILQYDRLELN